MAEKTFTKPKTETVSKKDTQKPFNKIETKKEPKVTLLATRNTQLPNGRFVGEGKEVVVASSYADKVLKEANTPFKLIIK